MWPKCIEKERDMTARALNAPPDLSSYSDKPTIKGIDGAQDFLKSQGLDVGHHALNDAVYYKKNLPRFKLGRYIHFSERDLMTWVYAQRGISRRG
jgi:hypothetical protein